MNFLPKIKREQTVCPNGCQKNDEPVLIGHDLIYNFPGEYTVVKCLKCGLMRTDPRPDMYSMRFFYPDNYGPYVGTKISQDKKPISQMKKKFHNLLNQIFNFNTGTLPEITPGRMLEIGCASGAFLHHMSNQGWQVQGIELSEKAAQAAMKAGHSVYPGPLETAPEPKNPFDLIVGWMVLEHLHDPVGGLKKLHKWASSDAWLVLSVPNAASLEFRLFKDNWYALHLPCHLYHFTPATIEMILSKSGWRLVKIHHQRVLSNLIASTGCFVHSKGYDKLGEMLFRFPEQAGKWHYLLYPMAWLLSFLGQTGRMTVWAKKTLR
jgi:SAM-dependent methyltransferase